MVRTGGTGGRLIGGAGATVRVAAWAASAAVRACAPSTPPPIPHSEAPATVPTIGYTTQVLPGPGIPADAPLLQANNNLDVIDALGSRWLAVRSSNFHFASSTTRMVVFRSDDDGTTWHTETVIRRGRDVREPRLLELNGSVFLYFFEAGTNPFAFQPGRIFATERRPGGGWTHPVAISPEDSVVWRTKTVDGVPYMVRYRNGSGSYSSGEPAIEVDLLTTTDGYDWQPVNPSRPVIHTGGAGETDFAFDTSGRLWGVMRNEGGERCRFGSLVCTAPPEDITDWTCLDDPRKFDSPIVFSHGDDIWMIARRQVANGGRYDLGVRGLPRDLTYLTYEAAYWVTPKRTALWHIDREHQSVKWVADLPSRGDCAFPGIVWTGPDSILVYDYSSPPGNDATPWVQGQLGPTNIYVTPIDFGG